MATNVNDVTGIKIEPDQYSNNSTNTNATTNVSRLTGIEVKTEVIYFIIFTLNLYLIIAFVLAIDKFT